MVIVSLSSKWNLTKDIEKEAQYIDSLHLDHRRWSQSTIRLASGTVAIALDEELMTEKTINTRL